MKTLLTAAILSLALLIPAGAQTLNINLDALAAKAKEKAEVTLEGPMLAEALKKAPEKVRDSVANVSRVFVRHYEFEKPGAYSTADIDAIRKQVSAGTGWSSMVSTKEEH